VATYSITAVRHLPSDCELDSAAVDGLVRDDVSAAAAANC